MTASLDWSRWLGALVALFAIPVGVLAGIDPKLAILAALGLAYVVVAFSDLAAGLSIFTFLGFVEVVSVGGAAKVAGLLLALSWFALIATRPRAEDHFLTIHPLMSAVIGLFIGWALLSSTWAESPGDAVTSASRYALDAMLFLIIFTAIRSPKQLGWVLLAFTLGAAVAAAAGIASPPATADGRIGSYELDPNQLGAVLVAGVPLTVALVALYRETPLRLVGIATGLFALVAIWLTASRGALVATAVALIAAVVIGGRWRPAIFLAAIVVAFSTFTYYSTFASSDTQQRVSAATQGESDLQEARVTLWQVAWRAFEENPVRGIGASNFQTSERHFINQPGFLARTDKVIDQPSVVHNSWLEIATETGIIGLGLMATILLFSLRSMLRAARLFGQLGERRMQAVALCVATALIGYVAALTFISGEYSKGLWVLLGLGPAILAMAQNAETERAKAPGPAQAHTRGMSPTDLHRPA
jgi:O-antigen ligase